MNRLTFAIDPQESPAYNAEAIGLQTQVRVDGEDLPYVLDIGSFFDALTEHGRLPVFTCDCGCFGCGGYYIDVSHTDMAWIWRNRYAPNDQTCLLEENEFHFAWDHVHAFATELLATLKSTCANRPDARLMSGVMDIDLRDRIPEFEAQLEAVAKLGR